MDFTNKMEDTQLLDNCLVISFRDADVSKIIDNLSFCICDVMKLVVLDPRQLYWIDDYNLDALVVSDNSKDRTFSREAYRILREISPDVILIAEGASYIDPNITSNISSQFDTFICFDADARDVQLAIKDAIQKRDFRLKSALHSSSASIHTEVAQSRYRPIPQTDTTPIWLETIFGLFWIAIVIGAASIFIDWN